MINRESVVMSAGEQTSGTDDFKWLGGGTSGKMGQPVPGEPIKIKPGSEGPDSTGEVCARFSGADVLTVGCRVKESDAGGGH